jgi:hypothetical protein
VPGGRCRPRAGPPVVDAQQLSEQPQHYLSPQRREPIELDGAAVKVLEQRIVEAEVKLQCGHDAGDAEPLVAQFETGHSGGDKSMMPKKCFSCLYQ